MEIKRNKVVNPNEYGSLLYDESEKEAVINVMTSRRIFRYSKTEFPYSDELEDKVCKKLNTKYCLGVINGTAGLITALTAIGIKPNDRVLVSSYTYIATALAVKNVGGIPIPLDLDLNNGVDMEDLESEIDKGCKAVIITHFQGRCFNLEQISKLLKRNDIYLIEDACQAFASNYKGRYAGTFGDIGVFSFQQYKQIASGEGGAVVTNNSKLYNKMRNYTDMGSVRDRFPNWNSAESMFGQNYRISNISAAILVRQMEKLDYMISKQIKSRQNILNNIKKYNIKSLINSKDTDGDTGMNIIFLLKDKSYVETVMKFSKEKYNVELRKMWSNLYFENKLFIDNKITDKDLKTKQCINAREITEKMLVISIPPILEKKEEEIISKLLVDLKDNNYID